jgi:type I restriction-modification system DNA methylase subunit
MRLTFSDAQKNVAEIANRESYGRDVIFELLAAYGRSSAAITKLRSGSLNLAEDTENEVLQRGVVYFKHVANGNLLSEIDSLDKDPLVVRYNPRYLITTDYEQLVAKDTKKDTTLDIKLRDIDRNVDFFYGWTGDEITSEKTEAVADRRAADKMKDLYAEIELVNKKKLDDPTGNFRHDLNVFFSRLLFCFFAEDTKIFSKTERTIFTNSIKDFTRTDGSDLDDFLQTLFDALDTEDNSNFTSPYSKFPYVNGTIFDTAKHNIAIPKFNAQARKLILDCGNLDWSAINPDIFGSMFQSIVDEGHRANNGMHYTSVPNIMKTIEPLFLDEIRQDFDKYFDDRKKLNHLWKRISKIKVFDPACGSGNFLIIAYKELRKLEHGIIDRLFSDDYRKAQLAGKLESRIKLDNFFGIEIDDFAHEIAILSLYLAKHQMNIEFEEHFGKELTLIPLKDNAKIVRGNSLQINWEDVCPNEAHHIKPFTLNKSLLDGEDVILQDSSVKNGVEWDEIYLIGNPPYLGSSLQDDHQKSDMTKVFKDFKSYKNLDLIAAWFKKGADYIYKTKAKLAFVTTNSICQGEQVALLWPYIFNKEIEIGFAYTSFKWVNGARNIAGVTVAVVGLRSKSSKPKYIYDNLIRSEVPSISAYLTAGSDSVFFNRRASSLSGLPACVMGSKPSDGGYLILDEIDKNKIISSYPQANKYIKKYTGSGDYINGKIRFCLWILDSELKDAATIPPIADRLKSVSDFRISRTSTPSTVEYSKYPNRFRQRAHRSGQSIIIPSVSSERREYIPIGFLNEETVVSNAANVIYDAPVWLFGLLSSKMHMSWIRAVAGKLEDRLRYSSAIVYANYPVPQLTDSQRNAIVSCSRNVLLARENHSEKTLADMYEPGKMPVDLRQAHDELDIEVDRLYRAKPYNSDEERLADLFSLYEKMILNEKEKQK